MVIIKPQESMKHQITKKIVECEVTITTSYEEIMCLHKALCALESYQQFLGPKATAIQESLSNILKEIE